MDNFETIETFDEINDTIYDSENFPIKNRGRSAARRKKTYFKGRNRFSRVLQKGFNPYRCKYSILEGMMRKTNVIVWETPNDGHRHLSFNKSNECRLASANDKIIEFAMEGV